MGGEGKEGLSTLAKVLGASGPEKVLPLVGVHVNIAAYAFCYWLTRPVEPFLLERLGGNAQSFGLLQSWFSFLMLLGGPFVGRICDAKGAHIGLMLTQAGSALGYGFTGLARNLPTLFLARIPTVFMHVMQASQAVVAHCASGEARAVAMGRLSLSYRVGMVAGSSLGGALAARIGEKGVMLLASAISFLSLPLTYACVPASAVTATAAAAAPSAAAGGGSGDAEEETGEGVGEHEEKGKGEKKKDEGLNLGRVLEVMRAPALRRLITMHVALSLGQGLLGPFSSTTSTVLKETFGLSVEQLGYTMTLQSVVGLLANIFLIEPAAALFAHDEFAVVKGGALANAAAAAAFALVAPGAAAAPVVSVGLLVPIGAASTVTMTTVSSLYSKSCDPRDAGTCIALQHAVGTFLGIFLPTAGAYLYTHLGGARPVGLGSAGLLLLAALAIRSEGSRSSRSSGKGKAAREKAE